MKSLLGSSFTILNLTPCLAKFLWEEGFNSSVNSDNSIIEVGGAYSLQNPKKRENTALSNVYCS